MQIPISLLRLVIGEGTLMVLGRAITNGTPKMGGIAMGIRILGKAIMGVAVGMAVEIPKIGVEMGREIP
jgi:hypothetical protein